MRDNATAGAIWSWGWGIGWTALATTNVVLGIIATDPAVRVDNFIAGFPGYLTPIGMLALPLTVMGNNATLESKIPSSGPTCAQLAEAEELFRLSAESQATKAGLITHVIGLVANAGVLLGIGFATGHWTTGAISAGVGLVLAEATVLTQPTGLVEDLRRYRAGQLGGTSSSASLMFAPMVGAGRVGGQLLASF
jgi:hypothetical protein